MTALKKRLTEQINTCSENENTIYLYVSRYAILSESEESNIYSSMEAKPKSATLFYDLKINWVCTVTNSEKTRR